MYRASKHHGFVALAIAAVMTVPLAGCEDDEEIDDEQVAEERAAGEHSGQELADDLAQEIGDPETAPEQQVVGQIASVTQAINEAELDHAELAFDRAEDTFVLELAEVLYDDHDMALSDEEQVLAELQASPVATTVSRTLEDEAVETTDRLEQQRGATFDRQYALNEVRVHAEGVALLDAAEAMSPNDQFAIYVGDLRAMMEDHLDYAIDVAEEVNSN